MKYFCGKDELHGTDCHEFFRGQWDGRFWNDDSLYIYDDTFRESGLRMLISMVIPDYSPYDTTEILPADWEQICKLAKGTAAETVGELEMWAESALKEHGMFTILGI